MPEPKFRHAEGEKWHEVRAIAVDGRRASVWERWLEFTPELLTLHARWDPGMMVHKHGHNSLHVLYVLAGEMTCGDVRCTPGMHITLPVGAAFGPFVAGPEGVELFEVMMGDPRSWPADPEGFAKLLVEKRASKLPDPPIELPGWLEDTRK
jgi:mannose-6-phosphate isomerase-like protein (cupin superfamily)